MAKITKATIAALNAIATSGYVSQAVGEPLLKDKLIQVDTSKLNDKNEAAAVLTEAGKKALGSEAKAEASTPATQFAIITNAVPPASKRGNHLGGGAPAKYPFASMEVGNSFFVPVSADLPDPVKTLGSTVSNANAKYAKPTGETKQVERTKRGEGNKAVLDANGNKVRETVTVEVKKQERKFIIRGVEKGKTYGGWVADADGALISREI